MSDEEKFIRKHGITKCPAYIADGGSTPQILEKIPLSTTRMIVRIGEKRHKSAHEKLTEFLLRGSVQKAYRKMG